MPKKNSYITVTDQFCGAGLRVSHKRQLPSIKEPNRICAICQLPYTAVSPLQKTCSLPCRKALWENNSKTHRGRNPDAMKNYNQTRKKNNPNVWKEKLRKERLDIISILGSKCIACGAMNANWLHIDYIPTMIGTGLRHPRHKKWVLEHIKDFRLLCANHHYELTITGNIEGTEIRQLNRNAVTPPAMEWLVNRVKESLQ